MKVQVSKLTGAALDWAVAKCKEQPVFWCDTDETLYCGDGIPNFMGFRGDHEYTPSTDWSQGGPIIEREAIDLFTEKHAYPESWCASVAQNQNGQRLVGWRLHKYGPTPLIAAMRCFVLSKMGNEVEIPEELL